MGGFYARYEALACRKPEEQGENGEDDRGRADLARTQKVGQDTQDNPYHPGGDARTPGDDGLYQASDGEEYPQNGADPAGEQPHLLGALPVLARILQPVPLDLASPSRSFAQLGLPDLFFTRAGSIRCAAP